MDATYPQHELFGNRQAYLFRHGFTSVQIAPIKFFPLYPSFARLSVGVTPIKPTLIQPINSTYVVSTVLQNELPLI